MRLRSATAPTAAAPRPAAVQSQAGRAHARAHARRAGKLIAALTSNTSFICMMLCTSRARSAHTDFARAATAHSLACPRRTASPLSTLQSTRLLGKTNRVLIDVFAHVHGIYSSRNSLIATSAG